MDRRQHTVNDDARIALRTDASPYGFGAILFVKGVPIVWLAGDWVTEDFNLFGAVRGDPAWQSEWEVHAALLARPTVVAVCSDPIPPLPCMQSCMLPAKPQAMNALAAEIALRLECANVFTVPRALGKAR